MMSVLLISLAIALLCIQLLVSKKIIQDELDSRPQKFGQLLLVWCFPLFGAVLVFLFRSPSTYSTAPDDRNFIPDRRQHSGNISG